MDVVSTKPLNLDLRNLLAPVFANKQNTLAPSVQTVDSYQPTSTVAKATAVLQNHLRQLSAQQLYQISSKDALDSGHIDKEYEKNSNRQPSEVFVEQVSRRVNLGLAENESAEAMSTLMDEVSKGAVNAHDETRKILQQLGALSAENSEYINRSESYTRFSLGQLDDSMQQALNEERAFSIDKKHKELQLTVTTQDGDEIDIAISINQQWDQLTFGRATSVEFKVDGDLSSGEQEALSKLLNGFAEVSDNFLQGADLKSLFALDAFDAKELQSFQLEMDGAGQSLDYNYSVQGESSQQVNLSWHRGDTQVADIEMMSAIGGAEDHQALKQMLLLLDEAEDAAHKGDQERLKGLKNNTSSNHELFKSSITNLFSQSRRLAEDFDLLEDNKQQLLTTAKTLFDKMSEDNPDFQGLADEEQARIKNQYSLLADYNIKLNDYSGGAKHDKNRANASGFNLSLAQDTQVAVKSYAGLQATSVMQSRDVTLDAVMDNKSHYLKPGGVRYRHLEAQESHYISSAIVDNKLVAADQGRERKEFKDELTYTGLGGYHRKIEQEESSTSSEIRILDDLWVERNREQVSGFTLGMDYHGKMLDVDSIYGSAYSIQREQLTIIGDLEKLAEDRAYRNKKLEQLDALENVMLKPDSQYNKIDTLA